MTNADHITAEFERKVCRGVSLMSEGKARYRVFTPSVLTTEIWFPLSYGLLAPATQSGKWFATVSQLRNGGSADVTIEPRND